MSMAVHLFRKSKTNMTDRQSNTNRIISMKIILFFIKNTTLCRCQKKYDTKHNTRKTASALSFLFSVSFLFFTQHTENCTSTEKSRFVSLLTHFYIKHTSILHQHYRISIDSIIHVRNIKNVYITTQTKIS